MSNKLHMYNKIISFLLFVALMASVLAGFSIFRIVSAGRNVNLNGNNSGWDIDTEVRDSSDNAADTTDPADGDPGESTDIPSAAGGTSFDITLMAVGDNLIHPGVYSSGKQSDGTYDYKFLYKGIEKYLDMSDVKIINQETIVAGDDKGWSGYPKFNTPQVMLKSLAESGFNVVLNASNHTRDMGMDGIEFCINEWKKYPEVLMTGLNETESDYYDIPIIQVKGIKIAIINYTYNLNSTRGLAKKEYFKVNILGETDGNTRNVSATKLNPKVLEDIETAEKIADFTIVAPHWGTEYKYEPTDTQKEWAKLMARAGADLIIGAHPHVIEPIAWVEADNGNKALCYYSLGNFVSTQAHATTMLGGLAIVKLQVENGSVSIKTEGTGVVPIVNHYTYDTGAPNVKSVMPLSEYTEELAAEHGVVKWAKANNIKPFQGYVFTKKIIQDIADKYFEGWILSAG